jgi:hypothetical protein
MCASTTRLQVGQIERVKPKNAPSRLCLSGTIVGTLRTLASRANSAQGRVRQNQTNLLRSKITNDHRL